MEEQSAPRIFDALRRYRLSSLVIVLLAVALSVGVTLLLNNEKTVSARIVPKMPDKASVTGSDSTSESTFVRYVKQRALFVTSDRVLADVSRKLNGADPVAELRKSVTADASPDGESITIDATADTVGLASRVANAVLSAYQDESRAESQANSSDALNTLEQQRAKVIDSIPRRPGSATNT
ncbi:MAG: cell shape-determining protein, partial [Sciscionella sp.]